VLLGALILDERLTARQAIGAVIVVLAVAGLLTAPRRRRTESAP
jgi:threonine/homoserine efflux transporter RhtA